MFHASALRHIVGVDRDDIDRPKPLSTMRVAIIFITYNDEEV